MCNLSFDGDRCPECGSYYTVERGPGDGFEHPMLCAACGFRWGASC